MRDFGDRIMRYEGGELTEDEVVELFQDLIDTGFILHLQGHYHRTANDLYEAGLVSQPHGQLALRDGLR